MCFVCQFLGNPWATRYQTREPANYHQRSVQGELTRDTAQSRPRRRLYVFYRVRNTRTASADLEPLSGLATAFPLPPRGAFQNSLGARFSPAKGRTSNRAAQSGPLQVLLVART